MSKIFLAEDDRELCERIRDFLMFEHYFVEVAFDGNTALKNLLENRYDAVILDWNMPQMTGIDVCRAYRAAGGTAPILLLTARSNVMEKKSGLDSGADDYLTKPFELVELTARLRALLRRPRTIVSDVLSAGAVSLNATEHSVHVGTMPVKLLPLEFALLEFLMRHPKQVFSAEALFRRVWPSGSTFTGDAVRTCIKSLRRKLDVAPDSQIVKTVHGTGYKVDHEE